MSWVIKDWNGTKSKLVVIPQKTDMNCFRVIKIRQPVTCCECGKKLPQKSWAYGSDWTRICLACGEKFSKTAIGNFKQIIKNIQKNLKKLEKNRDKWNAENLIASL